MSAVVERTQSVADQLDLIRAEIQELEADLIFAQKEAARCLSAADDYAAMRNLPTAAKAEVESLFAARIAGEEVSDDQIAVAEGELRNALADALRAESAEAGARRVATKFESAAKRLQDQIATVRLKAKPLIAEILKDRAQRSMAQHRIDAETFAKSIQARHHGEILAIAELAKQYGIAGLGFTHPNQGGRYLEVPCTPPEDRYLDVAHGIDLGPQIDAQASRVAAELHGLLP